MSSGELNFSQTTERDRKMRIGGGVICKQDAMLATIGAGRPIWDSRVLAALGLEAPAQGKKERLDIKRDHLAGRSLIIKGRSSVSRRSNEKEKGFYLVVL